MSGADVVPYLIDQLGLESSRPLKPLYIQTMASTGEPQIIPVIRELLNAENEPVRVKITAAYALAKIGDSSCLSYLRAKLMEFTSLSHGDRTVKGQLKVTHPWALQSDPLPSGRRMGNSVTSSLSWG
jgi:HEAT repeat protein